MIGLIIWLSILIPAAIIGCFCSYFIKNKSGIIFSGLIPWFGFLIYLLFHEYVILPNQKQYGGASMWLVAQLFAGTIAAVTGVIAYRLFKKYFDNSSKFVKKCAKKINKNKNV